jgi:hypothetical protein
MAAMTSSSDLVWRTLMRGEPRDGRDDAESHVHLQG